MLGIAYGGIFTFVFLTIAIINEMNTSIIIIWKSMLASFIIGIFFGLASFIFEHEGWSPLKKIVIHYSLSIACYFAITLFIGWVPLHFKAILITFIIFSINYTIYWFGYSLYYKKLEASLNEGLSKRK